MAQSGSQGETSVIIPMWQLQLAAETPAWVYGDGTVTVWARMHNNRHWILLAIPPLLVWICGSGYLMFHLWKTHPLDSSRKKVLWTSILVIPVIGWLLYGSFYGESKQESWIKL
jgi:hypothetical protein